VAVTVRLLLVIGLLAAHYPGCKVAAAQSLVPTRSHAPQTPDSPTVKCKKGCCSAANTRSSDSPKPDRSTPGKSKCPASCLNPLCSPAPALQPNTEPGVATDLGPAEQLIQQPQTCPSDAFRNRLDRPPRA
jgi:hypothetical protein